MLDRTLPDEPCDHIVAAMHNSRGTDDPSPQVEVRIKIMEAIARSVLLTARYNGQIMSLAPHALLARDGELFLRALNLTKNWRTAEDMRLGRFKLDGLTEVEVMEESFESLPNSEPSFSNEEEELLLAVG